RRARSTAGSAAPSSTSRSSRSRRRPPGSSSSSRSASGPCGDEGEAADPALALGALVGRARRRDGRLLRPADADLGRTPRPRLARGAEGQAAPLARHKIRRVPYVYDFDEPSGGGRELLGGKGVGLAEMTQLGVPVPAGFTITTEACRDYMRGGGVLPDGLADEIERHVAALERKTGKRFGDAADPLLVSVRSGAAISMPGMMDTILNVGLNDESVAGLARTTGNEEFARDCYRRLIQMFGETVDGIAHERFSVDDTVEQAREIYQRETGGDFPQDAREQLRRAIAAVFDSWNSPRAKVYRHTYEIPDDIGTAVNVVQMVFGNKGDSSATGVCFTRDPSTGEQGVYGEYLVNAQGEDVVAGVRTPQPVEEMRERLPDAYEQLLETMGALE